MPTPLIQSGLPSVPAGMADKEHKLLLPIYIALNSMARIISNATGLNTYSSEEMANLSPVAALGTQQFTRIFLKATLAFPFGKLGHIIFDGTDLAVEFADATDDTKPAQVICNQVGGVPVGGTGEFLLYTGYTGGIATSVIGATYYLGTNGDAQIARPAAAGSIIQAVGMGMGSLGFYLQISSLFLKN